MNDFDANQVPYRQFLNWTDQYPIDLDVKGGHVKNNYETIIITSNVKKELWFPGEDIRPLERRISLEWSQDTSLIGSTRLSDHLNWMNELPEQEEVEFETKPQLIVESDGDDDEEDMKWLEPDNFIDLTM